jgi:N-acetylglucosaminyldiphosphoundecaprenol N-acetyl-beta-D-mannosaminyltransferase
MAETLARLDRLISQGERFQICTPNFDHILLATSDEEFRQVLIDATLRVPDGMGVVYASRFLGEPIRELVGGRLLIEPLCALASQRGWRVVLVGGGNPLTAAKAEANLKRRFPALDVIGIYPGHVDARQTIPALDAILPCQILFVGLGTPKQEKWIHNHLADLRVGAAIGIGAGIDTTGGAVAEPPRWATAAGVEWLFRLIQDPMRLGPRYIFGIPRFAMLVARQRFRRGSLSGGQRL